ncbi:MAG TPA: hypothetical protein VJP77_03930, partial [Planctomycetota bacterium]|nr:hypothetical protein [Planctomycetota bacterium]
MHAGEGQPERRVGLGRAFEALFDSGRVLARPGSALLAGFLFPVFSFALAAPSQDGLSGLALELRQTLDQDSRAGMFRMQRDHCGEERRLRTTQL